MKFIAGEGCYSGAGRYYWDKEQEISIGRGCEYFATVAHEAAHTLGKLHDRAKKPLSKTPAVSGRITNEQRVALKAAKSYASDPQAGREEA